MAETSFRTALRQRWLAEFGDRFDAAEIESALDDVEMLRRCGERLARFPLELAEMPFSCILPSAGPAGDER
jgi:hypothetical protein